jgi:hypothetical protein
MMFLVDDIQVRRYRVRGTVQKPDQPFFTFVSEIIPVVTPEDMVCLRNIKQQFQEMFDLKNWEITVETTQDKWEVVRIDGTD